MNDDRGPRARKGSREPSLSDELSAKGWYDGGRALWQGVASDVEALMWNAGPGGTPKLPRSSTRRYFGVSTGGGRSNPQADEYTPRTHRIQPNRI